MRAIAVINGVLQPIQIAQPLLKAGTVRLKVHAAGVNRADLLQAAGRYNAPSGESPILGLEAAGTVIECAPDVRNWSVGDPAAALLGGGAYADEVIVPAGQLLPIPDGLSFVEAAALPEAFCTAHHNLFTVGQLQAGERVVLHAGASGVGTAAIQLCKHAKAPCFVSAGQPKKLEFCRDLGASGWANRHENTLHSAIKDWAPEGVDLILDPVGGPGLPDNLRLLKTSGRLVIIGIMGGRMASLDLGRLLVKRLSVRGSVLRSLSPNEKEQVVRRVKEHVWPLLSNGTVKPIVHRVFSLHDAQAAHELLRGNTTIGKLVLAL